MQLHLVASFFPLKTFIPLCFNILSTVPRENRHIHIIYYQKEIHQASTAYLERFSCFPFSSRNSENL